MTLPGLSGRSLLRYAAVAAGAIALLGGCAGLGEKPVTPTPVRLHYAAVAWNEVPGFADSDNEGAWAALLRSCAKLALRPVWDSFCAAASELPAAPDRSAVDTFLEAHAQAFHLVLSDGRDGGLITGYYEPFLRGSTVPKAPYLYPLYGPPDDLIDVELASVYPELKGMRLRGRLEGKKLVPYPDRAGLAHDPALKGKELVWVDDPLAAFFLEVQGSGRVELVDGPAPGTTIRLHYADQNGWPYKSIGRVLADRGEIPLEQVSLQSITDWAHAHPERISELLDSNPSFVFFDAEPVIDPNEGPKGALGVPLEAGRSIAVDARVVPLGAPVFLVADQADLQLHRLVVAQDTGGAIRVAPGQAVRADLFWGSGLAAGESAGRMKAAGKMWVILPRGLPPPADR